MQFDAPQAEPGLTRRARRVIPADAPSLSADQATPATRAQLRRLASAEKVTTTEPVAPISRRAARLANSVATPIELPSGALAADATASDTSAAEAPVLDDKVDATVDDDFERAARALRFTGQTTIPRPSTPIAEHLPAEEVSSFGHAATRGARARRSRAVAKRILAASFSVGVMGAVGMFALSMATPVSALAAAVHQPAPLSVQAPVAPANDEADDEIQAIMATSVDTELNRAENYQAETMQQVAADTGITLHSDFFVNNPNADIQWPFAVGVPVTDTWGPRWGSFHHGVDFTPGQGADIQSIADGTVRIATEAGGLYGVYVVVDHEIDGHKVSSLYAHMLHGSLKVSVGDEVTVGTILGNTGNTGLSYGPHTHFELSVDGTRIDPLPWLRTNAGG